jgi:hypothetical protein
MFREWGLEEVLAGDPIPHSGGRVPQAGRLSRTTAPVHLGRSEQALQRTHRRHQLSSDRRCPRNARS